MDNSTGVKKVEYELVPPDGGWGYIMFWTFSLALIFTLQPTSCFPLIFGPFLGQYNDETTAVTAVMSTFVAAYYLSGLVAYILLQLMTYRKVSFLGATVYCAGSLSCVFTESLQFTAFSYGILQGLGTGLLMSSYLTAVNMYFLHKKMITFTLGPSLVALLGTAFPGVTGALLNEYGFRGTQAVYAALSLHAFAGALTLQPVKWHMKRRLTKEREEDCVESLISRKSEQLIDFSGNISPENRRSISYQSLTTVTNHEERVTVEYLRTQDKKNYLLKLVDLSLLRNVYYWNMATGLSLYTFTEANFLATLPILLRNVDFKEDGITLAMTIYLTSDLAGKCILALTTILYPLDMKKLLLINMVSTVVFRIVFTANDHFWWIISITALMGCSRSIFQLGGPMIIAKEYSNNFSNAYTMCTALTGVASLVLGVLIGLAKHETENDTVVFHISTVVCLICAVLWTTEFIYKCIKPRTQK